MLSKRVSFTLIYPLPDDLDRASILRFLHDHAAMIDLSPIVIGRRQCAPPGQASADEQECTWWRISEKIDYLPWGLATGQVHFETAFHDLPNGLQTHTYAPMGLDLRSKWTLEGTLPGEPYQPIELGLDAPRSGLYLREDVDICCNPLLNGFIKKTMQNAREPFAERLAARAREMREWDDATMAVSGGKGAAVGSSDYTRSAVPDVPELMGTELPTGDGVDEGERHRRERSRRRQQQEQSQLR